MIIVINLKNNLQHNYKINNNVNIHPFKFKEKEEKYGNQHTINKNTVGTNHKETIKPEKEFKNDKSLIEFLVGNKQKESPIIEKKNRHKKNNTFKNLNIHNKRKRIKFHIIKKEK